MPASDDSHDRARRARLRSSRTPLLARWLGDYFAIDGEMAITVAEYGGKMRENRGVAFLAPQLEIRMEYDEVGRDTFV